ncbi:MAG: hypothetical protein JJU09_01235 [Rhodobacteraceae bacterium]|nr:hypothetical protein [Paracoccaceae bacterium]TVR47942.1 MAG: hypothetical protein EA386_06205 [Paracoccaceae bacterium]
MPLIALILAVMLTLVSLNPVGLGAATAAPEQAATLIAPEIAAREGAPRADLPDGMVTRHARPGATDTTTCYSLHPSAPAKRPCVAPRARAPPASH